MISRRFTLSFFVLATERSRALAGLGEGWPVCSPAWPGGVSWVGRSGGSMPPLSSPTMGDPDLNSTIGVWSGISMMTSLLFVMGGVLLLRLLLMREGGLGMSAGWAPGTGVDVLLRDTVPGSGVPNREPFTDMVSSPALPLATTAGIWTNVLYSLTLQFVQLCIQGQHSFY